MTRERPYDSRDAFLLVLLVVPLVGFMIMGPIPQEPGYHDFADGRSWIGVPNASNVLTNIPFLVVGLCGGTRGRSTLPWRVLFVSVFAVGVGSAYYHLNPNNDSLVWDRLPMTAGFTAAGVALWADYVDLRAQKWLGPVMVGGAVTVVYWALTDDLRLYLYIQVGFMLVSAGILGLFARHDPFAKRFGGALGLYVLAKLAEVMDEEILGAIGVMGGHGVKHLLAATALALLVHDNGRGSCSR